GWSRHLLVQLLETDNLLYKVVGMQLLVESTAVVMFHQIADAKLEPVLTDLLYYFERDEARHVGLGVLSLPAVLTGLSQADAARLWWFQTKMNLEMIMGGINLASAFETLGIDQAEMNLRGFKYHREILKRMKAEAPDRGADAKEIRGLFKISRAGQDWFQRFLFSPQGRNPVEAKVFDALVAVAQRTDRWLADRAPVT
ncbi:MAG: hypothetical protein JNL83_28960, partial [Myxococcales bacterium]|nr:hypothetical protein [Myxococcales bacterium]